METLQIHIIHCFHQADDHEYVLQLSTQPALSQFTTLKNDRYSWNLSIATQQVLLRVYIYAWSLVCEAASVFCGELKLQGYEV